MLSPDGPSLPERELAIIEASRAIAARLGPTQDDLDAAFGPWWDFIAFIGDDGARLMVHWLDVFNPAYAQEPFDRRHRRRQHWRNLGFL